MVLGNTEALRADFTVQLCLVINPNYSVFYNPQ